MFIIVQWKTPIHAFFSCGDVIWIQCIKDRPCVLIETIKSNVAPRKVFLFQMYFVTSALDQTIITVGDKRVFFFAHYKADICQHSSLRDQDMTCPYDAPLSCWCPRPKTKQGESRLPVDERQIIFWSQTKCCVWTSIDRGYLQVLQLHFIVNDAMEGWTL